MRIFLQYLRSCSDTLKTPLVTSNKASKIYRMSILDACVFFYYAVLTTSFFPMFREERSSSSSWFRWPNLAWTLMKKMSSFFFRSVSLYISFIHSFILHIERQSERNNKLVLKCSRCKHHTTNDANFSPLDYFGFFLICVIENHDIWPSPSSSSSTI